MKTLVVSIEIKTNQTAQNFHSDLQEVCDDMNRAGYEFVAMYPMQEMDRVPMLNGQPRIKTSFTCVFTSFQESFL